MSESKSVSGCFFFNLRGRLLKFLKREDEFEKVIKREDEVDKVIKKKRKKELEIKERT